MNTILLHSEPTARAMPSSVLCAAAVITLALAPLGRAAWLIADCVKILDQAAPILAGGPAHSAARPAMSAPTSLARTAVRVVVSK